MGGRGLPKILEILHQISNKQTLHGDLLEKMENWLYFQAYGQVPGKERRTMQK